MQDSCKSCHSSFNLDSFSQSTAEDWFTKVDDGTMPPAGELSDAEVEQVRAFLSCNNGG